MEISQTHWWWVIRLHGSYQCSVCSPSSLHPSLDVTSNSSCLFASFCFFPMLFLGLLFCSLTRQLHLIPSSAYSVSWFPRVSLTVSRVGAYRYCTALLLFAIIRKGALHGPVIWNFLQDCKAFPAVVLKCSLHLKLYIPACPSSQMASSCDKGSTWKNPFIGKCLNALCFRIAVYSIHNIQYILSTPASLSLLHSIFHALSLTSLPLPVH